jgi:integrase
MEAFGMKTGEIEIHDTARRLELAVKNLREDGNISDANRKTIEKFYIYMLSRGNGRHRVIKYIYKLRLYAALLNKDMEKAGKDDIVMIMEQIDGKPYSLWTKHDYKIMVKRFYKWLRGLDEQNEYPPEVKWIRSGLKNGRMKMPEELWSEEDVKKLVNAADNTRDKALIFALYESGCRVGEIASRRIKHIQFDKYGAVVIVEGKTGMRRIRLVSSVPALSAWLDCHPEKDNPEAPLWIGLGSRNKGDALDYKAVSGIFKRTAERSGVKKRSNPHLFRHSRATFLANHLTESQLKEVFGWAQGSDMAAVYVHLSGRDTDNAILHVNGIETENGEKSGSVLKPKNCPRCEFVNGATSKFCNRCAAPLDIRTALSIEEKTNGLAQSFAEALGKGAGVTEVARWPDGLNQEDLEKLAKLVVGYMK